MRILLGLFEACIGPPAYSLITDFFPPEKRTLANSVYSFGIYIGAALSNITILIIHSIGWRMTYFVIGCFGIFVGVLGIIVIRDPERGRFEPKKIAPVVEEEKANEDILFDEKEMNTPTNNNNQRNESVT